MQHHRLCPVGLHLLAIEHLKHHDIVTALRQRTHGTRQGFGVAIQVRDQCDQAALAVVTGQRLQGCLDIGGLARLHGLERMQQSTQTTCATAGRQPTAQLPVKHHQAHRVVLLRRHIPQGSRQKLRIAQLGDGPGAIAH